MRYAPPHVAELADALAPPPNLSPSEWAARNRLLPEASAARGARWRNETCPYLVDVMDAAVQPGVTQIALVKAAQTGASEAVNNVVGFLMEHAPCPILLVHPTASAAEAFSKERLSDMIRSTSALRAIVQDKRLPGVNGRPESTLALKMFPGGFLALGGANSPNTFARWSVRVAIADDCDRFPPTIGEEGDPGRLLVNRTTSFHAPLVIFVSTPVLAKGRICTLYAQSDQRRYVIHCPGCGRADYATWRDREHFWVQFENHDPATARLACPCGHQLDEPARRAAIAAGRWRPTAEPIAAGHVGFHLPAMLSPFVTLEQLATKFLTANHEGPMRLKEFINTQLAEGWEDPRDRISEADLMSHFAEEF